jgi:hypothetical protein
MAVTYTYTGKLRLIPTFFQTPYISWRQGNADSMNESCFSARFLWIFVKWLWTQESELLMIASTWSFINIAANYQIYFEITWLKNWCTRLTIFNCHSVPGRDNQFLGLQIDQRWTSWEVPSNSNASFKQMAAATHVSVAGWTYVMHELHGSQWPKENSLRNNVNSVCD